MRSVRAGMRDLLFEKENFSIFGIEQKNGTNTAKIKIEGNYSPNELIEQILPQAEVVSFKEILPSINDIFIQEVNRTKK